MKSLKVFLVVAMFSLFTFAAQAQSNQRTNVGQAVRGLINVNVGAVTVNVGDITLNDLVDVGDVLSNNNVRALNNVLNNSPIASNNSEILTNLLRRANLITDNQVVVGVLSGGIFLIQ
jgi:flagellar basal body-associated protein FliL